MSNFTLLRTLQDEKYAPIGERYCLNVWYVKYQLFAQKQSKLITLWYIRGCFHDLGWKDVVIECFVYNLG